MPTPHPARKYAVVTGASSGIGAAFAGQLAVDHDVVLVARGAERLDDVRAALARDHPQGHFQVVVADLSTPGGPQAVLDHLRGSGRDVDLLVNNAGAGYHGAFADQAVERVAGEIALDCVTVAVLAHGVLPAMLARGRGAIINVASTAAFQPVPSMAVYGANKAFVLSLSQALDVETRGTGVLVLALCPGGTDTGFFDASGSQFLTGGRQSPDQVAVAALRALQRGKAVEIPGLKNKLSTLGYRLVPRRPLAHVSGWLVRAR